jgi:HAD superfamily hydrolase (TIGR01509 family)
VHASTQNLAAVIFDMDGTLIESAQVIPAAYIATVHALDGPTYSPQQVIDIYSVGPPAAMLTELLGRPSRAHEVNLYHEHLAARASGATVYPGVADALEALRAHVGLAVFSGASTRACRILLGGTDLLSFFSTVVGGDEVARPKPEPDGVELACERLGVESSAAAYVGDAPNDLEAARRSGAKAFAAAWGHLYAPTEPAHAVLDTPGDLVQRVLGGSVPYR